MDDRQRLREARARSRWTPPGPVPPGDRGDPALVPGPGESLDAFAGHWRIFQLQGGHRYSTDDLLAAWFAVDTLSRETGTPLDSPLDPPLATTGRTPARALDLGSGIGSVGFFLLWAYPDLQLVGVEAQPGSLALALRTARYNGVEHRTTLVEHDLRHPLTDRGTFDLITGSPPYWDPADGRIGAGPQKGPCRFEFRGGVEAYCTRAAEALAPGGLFVLVYDGRQRDRLLAAATAAGLAVLRLRDVVSKAGRPPLLTLVAFTRRPGGTYPEGESTLLLRTGEGERTPEFRAIREQMGLPPGLR